MSNWNFIYKLLYLFIHYCYSVFEILWNYVKITIDFCHAIYRFQYQSTVLCNNVKSINKLPKHITILLGREEPSYRDLANIVLWCISANIPFISFYDCKGHLKKHQSELEYEVSKRIKEEDHVIWHNDPKTIHKNGFSGRKIHIKILSEQDGKESVVNLCKKIALDEVKTDFSIRSINEGLLKEFEFPDPDLGLYCGNNFNLHNYPQWQIRVTEFLNVKSHHNITLDMFIQMLLRYNRCEQRLGK